LLIPKRKCAYPKFLKFDKKNITLLYKITRYANVLHKLAELLQYSQELELETLVNMSYPLKY